MEQQRRLLMFGVLAVALSFGWAAVGPKLFPGLFPPQNVPHPIAEAEKDSDDKKPTDADSVPEMKAADAAVKDADDAKKPDAGAPAANAQPELAIPQFATQTVTLGSMDPKSPYGLSVEISSIGAAVRSATLNDPRYPVAQNAEVHPHPQLKLLGHNVPEGDVLVPLDPARPALSLDLVFSPVDDVLKKINRDASLRTINWELVDKITEADGTLSGVTFAIKSPDGRFELRKKFQLNRLGADIVNVPKIRDTNPTPYQLDVALQIRNNSGADQVADYLLQGPAGLPLEHPETTRKYRDIKAGFVTDSGTLSTASMTASELVKATDKDDVEEWTRPVHYAGVDTQYFAVFLQPVENQLEHLWYKTTKPVLLKRNEPKEQSDISLQLASAELEIPKDGAVEHRLKMYLGPKRVELLQSYQAEKLLDYGFMAILSHPMVWLVGTFHDWGAPYWLAIIMLTVCVRACLFPISRKMAESGKRMKALQPQIMELREKFKDDKQKLGQAQMELYAKEGINPLAGCLPALIQLPIFISLYQALSNWVDLRMAPFLWIEDLAAPDALFAFPVRIPFFGWDFNLLPLITMVLFFIQQKLVMPPAMNEEMEQQQKMMNIMSLVFGFLFYHVPAGLCVYFIASSCWSMTERQILERLPQKKIDPVKKAVKKNGFMARMMKQLQEAAELQKQLESQRNEENRKRGTNGRDKN